MRRAIWIAAVCSALLSTAALCAASLSGIGTAAPADAPVPGGSTAAQDIAFAEVVAWAVFTAAAALSGIKLRRQHERGRQAAGSIDGVSVR